MCQPVRQSGKGENCIVTRRRVASTAPPVLRQNKGVVEMVPYDMSSNFCYQCPITGKEFEFSQDKASKKDAFAAQQLHTGGHIQRLEQAAGREMTYRELIRAGCMERQQAAAAAKEEAVVEKPQETGDPLGALEDGVSIRLLIVMGGSAHGARSALSSQNVCP